MPLENDLYVVATIRLQLGTAYDAMHRYTWAACNSRRGKPELDADKELCPLRKRPR